MRLIDADALWNALNDAGGTGAERGSWADGWDKAIDEAICLVEKAHAVEPAPQWIPVKERLPEKLVPVLIQHTYMKYAGISIGYITTYGYWEWFGYFMGDDMLHRPPVDGLICPGAEYVIAWMPLPEPYNPEGAEAQE